MAMVHVLHLLAAAVPTPVEQTAFDGNVTFGSMVRLAGSVNNTLSVYDGYTLSVIENPLTNKLEAIVGTDSGVSAWSSNPPAPHAARAMSVLTPRAYILQVVRTADGVTWSEVTGSVPSRRGEGGLDLATPPPFIHNFGNTQARYARKDGPITDFWGTDPIAFSIDSAGTLVDTVCTRHTAHTGHAPPLHSHRALFALRHVHPVSALQVRTGVNVTFTGLPRPLGCSWVLNRCCTCPFRADSGNAVRLADGSLVMTMNVFLKPLITNFSGDGSSVVACAPTLIISFFGLILLASCLARLMPCPPQASTSPPPPRHRSAFVLTAREPPHPANHPSHTHCAANAPLQGTCASTHQGQLSTLAHGYARPPYPHPYP
jgi:hypothetical protein